MVLGVLLAYLLRNEFIGWCGGGVMKVANDSNVTGSAGIWGTAFKVAYVYDIEYSKLVCFSDN
jgi:hypothetical protein